MAVISKKKMVTTELTSDKRLLSGLMVLMLVYLTYELEFLIEVKFPFKEKLLGIPEKGKLPLTYSNFFRATTCVSKVIIMAKDIESEDVNPDSILFKLYTYIHPYYACCFNHYKNIL